MIWYFLSETTGRLEIYIASKKTYERYVIADPSIKRIIILEYS